MNDDSWTHDPILSTKVIEAVETWAEPTERSSLDRSLSGYHEYVLRKWAFILVCFILIFIITGIALTVGPYDIGFLQCYEILWNHITGNYVDGDIYDHIIVNLRLPRIVLGIFTGAGLAVAGVVMQSTLMNPLADPYTTGVSSGASFGATLAIGMGMTVVTGYYGLVLNAFLFSLIPSAAIVVISKFKHSSPTTMIMAGIAIMYIFNSLTTVMRLWSDPDDLRAIYYWSVGSLSYAGWDQIPFVIAAVLVGSLVLQILTRKINVLATGDEMANALGINADNLRIVCLVVVALMTATVVCFTGLIGFVGLVAPHMVRLFIGADNRYLLPASMAFGAALLIGADLIGRVVLAPIILEVGVVTSFLGGPMFLWLIVKKKSELWG